mgnify:CR=1
MKKVERRQKIEILRLCQNEVQEAVIKALMQDKEHLISQNELIALQYFGMNTLEKDKDNIIIDGDKQFMIDQAQHLIDESDRIIGTDVFDKQFKQKEWGGWKIEKRLKNKYTEE